MHEFKSDNGEYQRCYEEEPPECGGFIEKYDTDNYGADSSDAGPHWIGSPNRDSLHCLRQQHHAEGETQQEARAPQASRRSRQTFHLAEAEGKTRLKAPGDNEHNPIHTFIFGCPIEGCSNTRRLLPRLFPTAKLAKSPDIWKSKV